jgi:hypothetical protein
MKLYYWMLLGAFLAPSSYAATTYYINPSCPNDGNGTSPGCAVGPGQPGAYSRGGSLVWGTGNTFLLRSGTTLYDLPTIVRGTGTTLGTYGGTTCATIWRPSGVFVLSIAADDVTVDGLCLTGNVSSAILNTTHARTQILRSRIFGNRGGGVGIRFNNGASDGVVTDSATYNIDDDGIGIGALARGTFTITRHDCHDVDKQLGTGDCIQAYDGTIASLTVRGGVLRKETAFKSAIRYSGSGVLLIEQGVQIELQAPGALGVSVDGTGVLNMKSSYIKALPGSWGIFAHNTGNSFISNVFVDGGDYGVWSSHPFGSLTVSFGAVVNQTKASIYHTSSGAGGALFVNDTILEAPQTVVSVKGTSTVVPWTQ